jgi:hypothetical protein
MHSALRFEPGAAHAGAIQAVVDEVLAELRDPASHAAGLAWEATLEPAELASAHVAVVEDGDVVVAIAAAFGPEVAETFWREVISPRVRERLGAAAVGPSRS